jgi:lipopolysaccharide export system permease protein
MVSVLSRYLVAAYLRAFIAILSVAGLVLFLLEIFEKAANIAALDAPAAAVAGYLALKIPKILMDAYPATALLAVLLSLGLLARGNEMLALRACGVSPWRVMRPLLLAGAALVGIAWVWAEHVVPTASGRSRALRDTVIKLGAAYGGHEGSAIWVRSAAGFVRVEFFDSNRTALYGVSVFQTDEQLRLRRVLEAPQVEWEGTRWRFSNGVVKEIDGQGRIYSRPLDLEEVELAEPPLTFEKRRPRANEMTYRDISRFIAELDARGVASIEYRVERALKVAWPFAGIVAILIGAPLGMRGGLRYGIGYNMAAGLLVGFAYWLVFAVFAASGKNGDIAPAVAAWGANLVFAGFGLLLARFQP